jgi:hypothetical protein
MSVTLSNTAETINSSLEKIISRVEGLYGIVISDQEGAVYSRVMRQDSPSYLPLYPVQMELPDVKNPSKSIVVPATDPGSILFVATVERGQRIGCGTVKTVTTSYQDYQVIYSRFSPLTLTFVAALGANRALLYSIIPELEHKLQHLRAFIEESHTNAKINNETH